MLCSVAKTQLLREHAPSIKTLVVAIFLITITEIPDRNNLREGFIRNHSSGDHDRGKVVAAWAAGVGSTTVYTLMDYQAGCSD